MTLPAAPTSFFFFFLLTMSTSLAAVPFFVSADPSEPVLLVREMIFGGQPIGNRGVKRKYLYTNLHLDERGKKDVYFERREGCVHVHRRRGGIGPFFFFFLVGCVGGVRRRSSENPRAACCACLYAACVLLVSRREDACFSFFCTSLVWLGAVINIRLDASFPNVYVAVFFYGTERVQDFRARGGGGGGGERKPKRVTDRCKVYLTFFPANLEAW